MNDTSRPSVSRRALLQLGAAMPVLLSVPGVAHADGATFRPFPRVRDKVPDPKTIFFDVKFPGKEPVRLAAHYWLHADAAAAGRKCPAIVEFNPYRRRDGMLIPDSMMYPWYAYNEYLCVRVDLQGTGDSDGVIDDEYTQEELSYCAQVIEQVAAHPLCDGKVGMMGKSWSAINSLMLAASPNRPAALKAVIVSCGTDDRYNDDVHYMGGAMMFDNFAWPSTMWSWLPAPPDPAVVGDDWVRIWRQRIRRADFWFKYWGGHQLRDAYWSETSVRDRYRDVGVPVFIFSGWQDGYHNPTERAVSALGVAGRPVSAIIGPWGHKYPFDGYPGPRIDWLRYSLTHWWDRWLKGRVPDAAGEWPQMPVWLGLSREPYKSSCGDDPGRWVAEDADWRRRSVEKSLYLAADGRLAEAVPAAAQFTSDARLVDATAMLETSSWGECGNDDVPVDQAIEDRASLRFDSAPLPADLDVFGYPVAELTLSADRPVGSIAVRLCEVSPATGASHLVSYSFFNLCHRGGDMARAEAIEPGRKYHLRIPLGLAGHTFRRGWRVRLSVSSSHFMTLWAGTRPLSVTLYAGAADTLPASRLVLPTRPPRREDTRAAALLPAAGEAPYIDTNDYVPVLAEARPVSNSRTAHATTVDGRPGIAVDKVLDSGRYQYGGLLDRLWVDIVLEEHYRVAVDDPLSLVGTTRSVSIFERPHAAWRARIETATRLWNETAADGTVSFKYEATIRTWRGAPDGSDQPFEERRVEGAIPRTWV